MRWLNFVFVAILFITIPSVYAVIYAQRHPFNPNYRPKTGDLVIFRYMPKLWHAHKLDTTFSVYMNRFDMTHVGLIVERGNRLYVLEHTERDGYPTLSPWELSVERYKGYISIIPYVGPPIPNLHVIDSTLEEDISFPSNLAIIRATLSNTPADTMVCAAYLRYVMGRLGLLSPHDPRETGGIYLNTTLVRESIESGLYHPDKRIFVKHYPQVI